MEDNKVSKEWKVIVDEMNRINKRRVRNCNGQEAFESYGSMYCPFIYQFKNMEVPCKFYDHSDSVCEYRSMRLREILGPNAPS